MKIFEHAHAGQHSEDLVEGSHLSNLFKLIAEVLQRETIREQLLLKLYGLFLVDNLLGLLDQRQDIAHPHDPGDEPVRMEELQRVILLAGAHEFHRLTGNLPDGQGRAAASIAVHLRENKSVEPKLIVELLRAFHGVLPKHGVGDEKDLMRMNCVFNLTQFLHERLVDVQPPCRIDDQNVMSRVARFPQRSLAKLKRVLVGIAFP